MLLAHNQIENSRFWVIEWNVVWMNKIGQNLGKNFEIGLISGLCGTPGLGRFRNGRNQALP